MTKRHSSRWGVRLVSIAIVVATSTANAQAPRQLLTGHSSEAQLARALASAKPWHPYPVISERAAWSAVPDTIRAAYIHTAERRLGTPWPSIPATITLQYVRDGNRSNYDGMNTARRERLADAVMAEVFENKGRFLDEVANGIWAISEQTFWGSTAHLGAQKVGAGLPDAREPVVELFSAETAALFAWTDYLLGARLDSVSPRLRERMHDEVDRRLLTPALERDDFWWMGFGPRKDVNNWNPWINSNWLASVLILERDPARRARAVHKIMRSLDNFLDVYPADGGCDEGPSYWGRAAGSLYESLELLRLATNGAVDIFDAPLVRNMGAYIYRVYVKDDYFVNTGDAGARLTPDPELVFRYGQRIHDPMMEAFGAFLRQRSGVFHPGESSLGRIVPAVLAASEIARAKGAEPLLGEAWLPDLQLMAARRVPGSSTGLYVAAIGGHNAQSHNHNDVGNFVVYDDGKPLLIDVGVETYTAKTFSSRRYEIWTMQSAYHNLPTVNGVMQKDGAQYRAEQVKFSSDDKAARFSLDIAKAYPVSAGVDRWQRDITLDRPGNEVRIDESFALSRVTEPVRLNFMTSMLVDVSRSGEVHLRAKGASHDNVLRYDATKLKASTEEIPIRDARLHPVWGDRLARVVLTSITSVASDSYHIVIR
jgi:hypothetical protein